MENFPEMDDPQISSPVMNDIYYYMLSSCCKRKKSISSLDTLHDSILYNIQQRLTNTQDLQSWALSCKRLYLLESLHRKRLSLLRLHPVPLLAHRYPFLQHLNLSSCTFVSDEGLQYMGLYLGERLLSLNLSTVCTFSDVGLLVLSKSCTTLLQLDLSRCSQVGNLGIMALSHIRTLHTLKLNGCVEVSDSSIGFLAMKCRNLRSLSLKWCIGITDYALCAIGAHCSSLQELDVSYTEITNASIVAICKLKYLMKLSLVACSRLDDEGIIALKHASRLLQTLDVSRCRSISYKGVMELASEDFLLKQIIMSYCHLVADPMIQSFGKLKNLQTLHLDGCDMSLIDLGQIGKCCRDLEELSLSKCKGVRDAGLSAGVIGCPKLKSIDLTCCSGVTDKVLLSLGSSCTGLLKLKMESCCNFTEHGLKELCSSCELLEELDLTDSSLNDAGLLAISNCRYLKVLRLGVCEDIHDTGLSYIALNCLDLRELDMYRSVNISDEAIGVICSHCIKLRSLNISYCTKITDAALFSIAKLLDLRVLELRGCIKVSLGGLCSVAKKCQNLEELDIKKCESMEEYAPLILAQCCKSLRQVNLSYCSATDEGIVALAKGRCMQRMRLVHVRNVSVKGFSRLLLAGESLKKVKLLVQWKDSLPWQLIERVQARGCRLQWVEKI